MSAVLPIDDRFERIADALAQPAERHALEALLPAYLRTQRWFGGQARSVGAASFLAWLDLGLETDASLCLVEASDAEGLSTRHQLYLGVSETDDVPAVIDALEKPAVREFLGDLVLEGRGLGGDGVSLRGRAAADHGASLHGVESHLVGGEQSNSSVMYGSSAMLKVYRRLEEGPHPELELLEALNAGGFEAIPAPLGSARIGGAGEFEAVAMLLVAFVSNEGDGWAWGVEMARRALDACSTERELAEWLESDGAALEGARDLGVMTARMHTALAVARGEGMAPEPMSAAALEVLAATTRAEADATRELMHVSGAGQDQLFAALDALAALEMPAGGERGALLRVHGDYHLGQVLRSAGHFVVTDFEGEPARPLAERRRRQPALVDLAGMVRSFDYAGQTAARAIGEEQETLAKAWANAMAGAFLAAYWEEAERSPVAFLPAEPVRSALLHLLIVRKALYELRYELNNRPDWAEIPLRSIIRLGETRT